MNGYYCLFNFYITGCVCVFGVLQVEDTVILIEIAGSEVILPTKLGRNKDPPQQNHSVTAPWGSLLVMVVLLWLASFLCLATQGHL